MQIPIPSTAMASTTKRRRMRQGIMVCFCLSLILACLLSASTVDAKKKKKKKKSKSSSSEAREPIVLTNDMLNLCVNQPAITNRADQKVLKWFLEESGKAVMLMSTTPQHMAACWMFHYDRPAFRRGKSREVVLQRYALAALHFATTQSNTKQWDWNIGAGDDSRAPSVNGNWLSVRLHECKWYGVTCSRSVPFIGTPKVTALALGFLKLDGLIPRELSLLTNLKEMDLHGNDVSARISIADGRSDHPITVVPRSKTLEEMT